MERNQPIIVITAAAKFTWLLYRAAPELVMRIARRVAERNPLVGPRPTQR